MRHFLACCDKNAVGHETSVRIQILEEFFNANGLIIKEKNYLEIFTYEKWTNKAIDEFKLGQKFSPDKITSGTGTTCPPNLLNEADLITLMEKYEIGTDATHAEHIETIKSRGYVMLSNQRNNVFLYLNLQCNLKFDRI